MGLRVLVIFVQQVVSREWVPVNSLVLTNCMSSYGEATPTATANGDAQLVEMKGLN